MNKFATGAVISKLRWFHWMIALVVLAEIALSVVGATLFPHGPLRLAGIALPAVAIALAGSVFVMIWTREKPLAWIGIVLISALGYLMLSWFSYFTNVGTTVPSDADPKQFTLRAADLPGGGWDAPFGQRENDPLDPSLATSQTGGYLVLCSRDAETLNLFSSAYVFANSQAAERALQILVAQKRKEGAERQHVLLDTIGDDAAYLVGQTKDGGVVRFELLWRRQNVLADIDLQGMVPGQPYLNDGMLGTAVEASDGRIRTATQERE